MMRRILDLPLLVILMGMTALAMFLPAAHALMRGNHFVARPFFYGGMILLIFTTMIALATANFAVRNVARSHLTAFVAAYLVLPVMMAIPFHEALLDTSFMNAWFEMISSFTTTGASVYEGPGRLPESLHLWRAICGWMGGFFALLMAVSVLAPMNLGGIEVITGEARGYASGHAGQGTRIIDPSERITRYAILLFPAYGGLTLLLWIALVLAGDSSFLALIHAMGTLSTSGISSDGGFSANQAGFLGELLIFLFLLFALTRRSLPGAVLVDKDTPIYRDPEVVMGLVLVVTVTAVLFLRHWVGAIENQEGKDLPAFFSAIWGAGFTALSFLTTTGYASADWTSSRVWSGLETHGLILLGLAIIGGGVATTAGGVKLLRVYALFRHGQREMERLIHPHSIGGAGKVARLLRREGAYMAWVFFMLFALSIAIVIGALSLVGLSFEPSLVLAIAALTTTGPLASFAADAPVLWADLTNSAKVILAIAMVLGRVETLALLALLAPDNWRR